MTASPFDPLILEAHRTRILEEIGRLQSEISNAPTAEEVEALFNRTAFVANKANILVKAIEEAADKYFIPVGGEELEVRAAVSRKSADSKDGSKISFDLFKDAVKFCLQVKKDMEQNVVLSQQITTGSVLQRRIKKIRARASLLVQTGTEPDDNMLEMLLSQFITLWIAHELMKPFEAMTDHLQLAQTWVEKESGGSEAQIAMAILIGLAMQLLIMGLNDDAMEYYLDKAAGGKFPSGFTAKDLVAKARGLEPMQVHRYAELNAGLNDYEVILRYAFDFLGATIDPGYDMWTSYVDVINMRSVAQNMWVQAPHYSVSHAIVSQQFTKGKKNPRNWDKQPKGSRIVAFNGGHGAESSALDKGTFNIFDVNNSGSDLFEILFKSHIADSLVPMSPASFAARKQAIEGLNDNLDLIAQVLSSDFAIRVACCLGRFLGKLDPSVLKSIKALLEGLLRAYRFDFGQVLKSLLDSLVSPNFEEVLAMLAMQQIDEIFGKLIDKVVGLFGEDMLALQCCPLVGEMIDQVLSGILRLEAELKGAVKIFLGKLLESISTGKKNIELRFEQRYEERTIRKMILILDAVINAANAFEACGEENKLYSPLPDAIRADITLPTIRIDENEKTNYFTSALPRQLSNGKFLPELGKEIESLTTAAAANALGQFMDRHNCGGSFNEEAIEKAATAFRKGY